MTRAKKILLGTIMLAAFFFVSRGPVWGAAGDPYGTLTATPSGWSSGTKTLSWNVYGGGAEIFEVIVYCTAGGGIAFYDEPISDNHSDSVSCSTAGTQQARIVVTNLNGQHATIYATYYIDNTAPQSNPPMVFQDSVNANSALVGISSGVDSESGLAPSPYGFSISGGAYVWTSSPAYNFTGLSPQTSYLVTGMLKNNAGLTTSPGSTWVTTAGNPPAAPYSASASAQSQSSIYVTWADGSNNEDGFQIFRNGSYLTGFGPNVTAYNSTGLSCGTSYSYYVRAYNSSGASGNSNTTSATTVVCTPTAPTANGVSPLSDTSVNVYWTDNSNNETGFKVFRSPNGSSWSYITTTAAGATSYVNSGLSCGTTYYYYIAATNAGGDGSSGTVFGATSACPTAPNAPSGLTATAATQSQVNVAWTDNSNNETGFYMYRNGSYVTNVGANVTSYSHTGLSCGVSYNFTVYAYNAVNASGVSNTASRAPDACTPGAPSGGYGVASGMTTGTLYWNQGSPTNQTGYEIRTGSNGSGTYLGTAQSANYAITGQTCGTTVTRYIRAYVTTNGRTYYSGSTAASLTTQSCLPTPASNVTTFLSGNNTQMNIAWDDNSSNETGFKVYKHSHLAAEEYFEAAVLVTTTAANVESYSDYVAAGCGRDYEYYVVAYNINGDATMSNYSTEILVPCPAEPPLNVSATPSSQTAITISWTDVSDETQFNIYRNGSSVATVGANVTSYVHNSGLSCNTSYSGYTVRSYNFVEGESVNSNSASATTDACTPGVPSNIGGSAINQTTINVSWTRNAPLNESGFEISDPTSHVSGTATAGQTSGNASTGGYCGTSNPYADVYVRSYVTSNGRTYYSSWSSPTVTIFSDECTPGAPTSPVGTPASQSTGTLSWTAPASTLTGYEVRTGASGGGTLLGTTGSTSYNISGQACNTSVTRYVRTYVTSNGRTYYSPSTAVTLTTDQCTPGAPTSPVGTPTSQTAGTIAWSVGNPATQSAYEVRTGASGGGSLVGTTAATSYSITGQTANTAVTRYVRAYVTSNGRTYYSGSTAISFTTDAQTPGVPTNTGGSAINQTTVNVTWTRNAPLNETGFDISEPTGQVSGSALAGQTNATVTNTQCGPSSTSNDFRIRSYVTTNGRTYYSSWSSIVPVYADACTPGTPTIGTATATGQTTASLTWTDTAYNETGFYIFTYLSSNSTRVSTTTLATTNIGTGNIASLSALTGYKFKAAAYVVSNGRTYVSSESAYSNTITTQSSDTTAPTIVFAPDSSSWASTTLSVTPTASDPSGVGFTRHCWTSSGTTCDAGTSALSTFTNGNALTQPSTGTWYLCVRASDNSGNTNWASVSAATCGGPYRVDKTAPAAVAGLTAAASGQTTIAVNMNTSSDSHSGLHAQAYGYSTNGTTYTYGTPQQTLTGFSPDTSYTVRAKIRDAVLNETAVVTAPPTTTDKVTSGVPTIGSATVTSQTAATITWTAVAPLTQTNFQVRAYDVSTGAYLGSVTTAAPSATSASYTGLACGKQYHFSVRSLVLTNTRTYYSSYSGNTAIVTTDACTPSGATIGTATVVSQTAASLAWSSASTNESGFYIYVYPSGGGARISTTTVATVNATSGNITGLTAATGYRFTVSPYVVTGGGRIYKATESGYSNSISTLSNVATPDAVEASSITTTVRAGTPNITANWDGDGERYVVLIKESTDSEYELLSMESTVKVGEINARTLAGFTCPANYTLAVFAINIDAGLNGSDPASSCSTLDNLYPNSDYDTTNRKCSPIAVTEVRVDYCSKGFFQD